MDLDLGILFACFRVFITVLFVIGVVKLRELVFFYIAFIKTIISNVIPFRAPLIGLAESKFFFVHPIAVTIDNEIPFTIGCNSSCTGGCYIVKKKIIVFYISDLAAIRRKCVMHD